MADTSCNHCYGFCYISAHDQFTQQFTLIKMGIKEQRCTLGNSTETECVNKSGMTCNEDLQVNLSVIAKSDRDELHSTS